MRLARLGYEVAALNSDTYEEAPADIRRWLSQRRRWIKGWIQTAFVHFRTPVRAVRELGAGRAYAAFGLILGTVFGSLFGPFYFVGFVWDFAFENPLMREDSLRFAEAAVSLIVFVAGAISVAAPAVIALRARGLRRLYPSLLLLPAYYCLVSLAAWLAVFDLLRSPFHWAKTEHGLAKTSLRTARLREIPEIDGGTLAALHD